MEGFSTHGTPDPCPYTDQQLGYGKSYGDGKIERVKECERAWHAIGHSHREVLAAYYVARQPGRVEKKLTDEFAEVDKAQERIRRDKALEVMRLPPEVHAIAKEQLELSGVMLLLYVSGTEKKALLRTANEAVRVSHEVWQIERAQVDRSSDVRWKTSEIACPRCDKPAVPGNRRCACGHEFWGAVTFEGGL